MTDTAVETVKRIAVTSPFSVDAALVRHWQEVRRNAIEIGLIAERNLIESGALAPAQRRIITREESRNR